MISHEQTVFCALEKVLMMPEPVWPDALLIHEKIWLSYLGDLGHPAQTQHRYWADSVREDLPGVHGDRRRTGQIEGQPPRRYPTQIGRIGEKSPALIKTQRQRLGLRQTVKHSTSRHVEKLAHDKQNTESSSGAHEFGAGRWRNKDGRRHNETVQKEMPQIDGLGAAQGRQVARISAGDKNGLRAHAILMAVLQGEGKALVNAHVPDAPEEGPALLNVQAADDLQDQGFSLHVRIGRG
jgi:hypothetical protein